MTFKIIMTALFLTLPLASFALSWNDLWFTPNQQGAKLLKQNKPKQAAKKFTNEEWKGIANYQAKYYKQAVKDFSKHNSAKAHYNRGNALVQLKQYQAAIEAYDRALKQQPNFENAKYNKALVEKLLRQQKDKQQKKNNSQSSKSKPSSQNSSKNKPSDNKKLKEQKSRSKTKNSKANQQQPKQKKTKKPELEKPNHPQGEFKKSVQSYKTQKTRLNLRQQQAVKQWLQQIPDNPGGLLREKFLRDHLRLESNRQKETLE